MHLWLSGQFARTRYMFQGDDDYVSDHGVCQEMRIFLIESFLINLQTVFMRSMRLIWLVVTKMSCKEHQ